MLPCGSWCVCDDSESPGVDHPRRHATEGIIHRGRHHETHPGRDGQLHLLHFLRGLRGAAPLARGHPVGSDQAGLGPCPPVAAGGAALVHAQLHRGAIHRALPAAALLPRLPPRRGRPSPPCDLAGGQGAEQVEAAERVAERDVHRAHHRADRRGGGAAVRARGGGQHHQHLHRRAVVVAHDDDYRRVWRHVPRHRGGQVRGHRAHASRGQHLRNGERYRGLPRGERGLRRHGRRR
mmetsp:Transcript_13455/g.28599  ORF Transcript_13455/g.28599 Transcript_13455/m.28599 type:complete len:236 (-) Transcript_13455:137-844(-)